jgi:hypothetical protein
MGNYLKKIRASIASTIEPVLLRLLTDIYPINLFRDSIPDRLVKLYCNGVKVM